MARVRCSPDDVEIDLGPGQTLLAGLLKAGVEVAHACGGNAKCSTCRVHVGAGLEHCTPRTAAEDDIAGRVGMRDDMRLACQTCVTGAAEVRRLVIDSCDMQLVSGGDGLATVGRELHAAVMFADVAGFTTLSERLPPHDIMHLLNRYFLRVGAAIEGVGGYIDNYMGDGLMALFGVDGGCEDAALDSIRAGLEMQREADELSRYVCELYGEAFSIRVGIHWGPLVVGTLGSSNKRRETAIGDTVNAAARIEAANKLIDSRLLVSAALLDLVRDRVETGRTVEAQLKGKSGTHTLYEILAVTAASA